jgi:hypothetical protein
MKVIVNNQEVTIFEGARVCDAILAWSKEAYRELMNGTLVVTDHYGNLTAADGALTEGQKITLKKKAAL